MSDWGVSFSASYARYLGIVPQQCLKTALKELGVRRLRLMSYWNLHEKVQGTYDFTDLDWQFKLAEKYGVKVSLAVGLRQPHWPENHWPDWALNLPKAEWQEALLNYIKVVIMRYRNHPSLESWQLENEALLRRFGKKGEFSRDRLVREFRLLKLLDSNHPVIMTTSDSWGVPIRQPRPDMFGISIYRYFYNKGKYRCARRPALFYRCRAWLIKIVTGRPVFIHELQTEPWGRQAIIKISLREQAKTMDANKFQQVTRLAKQSKLTPVYLWGLEWWFWLKVRHNNPVLWHHAHKRLQEE